MPLLVFYIIRRPDQHLNYIQYANARMCSVFRQLNAAHKEWDPSTAILASLPLLTTIGEKELLATLAQYGELVKKAALQRVPHLVAHYMQTLANQLYTYYNAEL